LVIFLFQYDDCGTVEVFLTTEQKQWFSTVKKALTKKPKRIIHRPKVGVLFRQNIIFYICRYSGVIVHLYIFHKFTFRKLITKYTGW